MSFETPLTTLVWLTSVLCITLTYAATWIVLGARRRTMVRLATIITCGTLAGGTHPQLVRSSSTGSQHARPSESLSSGRR